MKKLAMFMAVAGLILAGVVPAQAATDVYVATTGDDTTGDGTSGNPYATVQKGVDVVDISGTVHVADGTYGANVTTGVCASITKSLTLLGESRDGTIIDGSIGGVGTSGSYWAKGIHVSTASNVTVKNFTVSGFAGDGTSTGGYGVLFRDYAHDTSGEGFVTYSNNKAENVKVTSSYSAVYGLVNEYLTVKNCLIENNASDGVFIGRLSHHATIEGNTVNNSGDQGIWFGNCFAGLGESDYGLIKDNTVNGAREAGINLCDSDNSTVSGNSITNADGEGWSIGALSIMSGSSNVEVFKNQINGNDCAGIGIGTPGSSSTQTDILIGGSEADHNDVYGNAGGGVWFRNATATDDIVITYNNLYNNTDDDFDCLDGGGITSTVTADARYNWWGADSDPVTAGKLLFDTPGDTILYSDWASSEVPEPGTMCLLVLGGVGALLRRKRRARMA